MELIKKSIGAAFWISLGVYGVLSIENTYVSAVLFSMGLFTVCIFKLDLFTGKCGFILETKEYKNLLFILIVNLLAGYIFGLFYSLISMDIQSIAMNKVLCWDFSIAFFIKSFMCGTIMYAAVRIFRGGSPMGIFIGIPMFIICGFQHCIANVVYMGVARTFEPALILCIIGNFIGSLFVWYLDTDRL